MKCLGKGIFEKNFYVIEKENIFLYDFDREMYQKVRIIKE